MTETGRWNFYWGRDSESRCLLILRYRPGLPAQHRLPKLKGIEIFVQDDEPPAKSGLLLRLLDSAQRDIFYRLCIDIIEAASLVSSEEDAVATTVARTWRWHHLLRGGSTGLLTPEEQMGLLAELLVFERYLLSTLAAAGAVASWMGPLGGAKDFLSGTTAIEVKALGRSDPLAVRINSAQQLDTDGLSALFLHVNTFGPPTDGHDGLTVTDVAQRVREQLRPEGESLVERFTALLAAAGFRFEDDYSSSRWAGGERGIYQVRDEFPRLTPAVVPVPVSHLRYILSLDACARFLVGPALLLHALSGGANA